MAQPLFPTRSRNLISGIIGVVSPGVATLNLDVNKRYHRMSFYTMAGSTPALVNPTTVITSIQFSVGGVVVRDITPAQILAIAAANGYTPSTGELPIFFSEPWRRFTQHETVTSWDMFGQSTFQIRMIIASGLTNPSVTGNYEFDYFRNATPSTTAGQPDTPFLSPIKQHSLSFPVPSGVYDITNIPTDYPIHRIWLNGGGAGTISYVQVIADGNTVHEGSNVSNNRFLQQYGFDSTQFDYGLVFDPTNHLREALAVANTLIVRVTSTGAQTVTAVVENRPGRYT